MGMKKIFTLMFVLSFVLYLSGMTFGQGRGGHGPGGAPEATHRHVDHDKSHARTETREDHKEANFEARIERNPELKSKVESMLPAGENLKTAASGFKNGGQFIAALHVSKNLGIPFDQLKATMLGTTPQLTATTTGSTTTASTTTGSKPMSLGQAIHTLQPSLSDKDAHKEADTSENQAKVDIKITTAPKPVS